MSHDWIKMRGSLVNHPRVVKMSRALIENNEFRHWLHPGVPLGAGQVVTMHALRCVTTSLLMCVWSVARAHGKFVGDDLHLPHSAIADIDEIAGAPGVGEAMLAVDWLEQSDGLWLRNFIEFNVPMTGAEKQKEYRKRKKNAEAGQDGALPTRGNEKSKSVTTREEKRRVLKNKQKDGAQPKRGGPPKPFSAVLQSSESPVENAIANAMHLFNLGQLSAQERDARIQAAKAEQGANHLHAASTDETAAADSSKPAGGVGLDKQESKA